MAIMMKAVRQHEYGGPEILRFEEVPRPEPGPGELLVRVHAAGVNPVDWKIGMGELREMLDLKFPFIPGFDLCGTVQEVGPKVTDFKPGDEVFAFLPLSASGAYAEYALVKVTDAAFKPQTLDHVQAAAVPLACLTAWQALFDLAGLTSGQRVLVHAAAGGVGHFAVQLARWAGAHVIGTASTGNLEFLGRLGVHQAVDYTAGPFEQRVAEVDLVLDTMSGAIRERSWPCLAANGILVTTLPPAPVVPPAAAARGVRATHMMVRPHGAELGRIAELIDSGHVRPEVVAMPFTEVRAAHELNQGGHTRGKIVLRVL